MFPEYKNSVGEDIFVFMAAIHFFLLELCYLSIPCNAFIACYNFFFITYFISYFILTFPLIVSLNSVNYIVCIQPWWLSGIMNSKFK